MLLIADNKARMVESLFKPVNGKTYDGYIIRKNKTGVNLFMLGEEWKVNCNGVLCAMRRIDGKIWYSYTPFSVTDKIGSYSEECAWCHEILSR